MASILNDTITPTMNKTPPTTVATPILPPNHTIALHTKIQKLATLMAEEEQINGHDIFYWNIISKNAMTAIAARVPRSLEALAGLKMVREEDLGVYGERLVRCVCVFVEVNRLEEYCESDGDGIGDGNDGGKRVRSESIVVENDSSSSSSSSSNPSPSTSSPSSRKRKTRRLVAANDETVTANTDDSTCTKIARLATPQTNEDKIAQMTTACRTILRCIGEDPYREGLLKTPERWAKALLFFTSGYSRSISAVTNDALFTIPSRPPPASIPPTIRDATTVDNDSGDDGGGQIILVKNITVHSLCEHHMVPFTGRVHVAYLPSEKIVGRCLSRQRI